MNKNDKNYVLEAFDYHFIIIIRQEIHLSYVCIMTMHMYTRL